jgi:hypothetical protein
LISRSQAVALLKKPIQITSLLRGLRRNRADVTTELDIIQMIEAKYGPGQIFADGRPRWF